jgi:hypothetical protein
VDNVRHTSGHFFDRKLYNGGTEIFQQSDKIKLHFSDVTLDPASKGNVVGMIRQMTTAF